MGACWGTVTLVGCENHFIDGIVCYTKQFSAKNLKTGVGYRCDLEIFFLIKKIKYTRMCDENDGCT